MNPYQSFTDALEKVYRKANQEGFGSTVLHGATPAGKKIDDIALGHYKYFMGSQWTADSEARWMAPWKNVFHRTGTGKPDILAELKGIKGPEAFNSIPLLTELVENADEGCKAMAAAFNHADVKDLAVHLIGDGDAMSGVMVTATYAKDYCISVMALMD